MKIKQGDKVVVISGKDNGKEGKVLVADRKKNKVIVEGVNMVTKHQKPGAANPQGGIVHMEAPIDASNVALLHKGKPTKIGYKVERKETDGKVVTVKTRIARKTGEAID